MHAWLQVVKNHFASEYIYNKYKNEKTCGIIERDASGGMSKVAEPVGVIAGEGAVSITLYTIGTSTSLPVHGPCKLSNED